MKSELQDVNRSGNTVAVPMQMLFTMREVHPLEAIEVQGEGGGLDITHKQIDALMSLANMLRSYGLLYGIHFRFRTVTPTQAFFDFVDEGKRHAAEECFAAEGITAI